MMAGNGGESEKEEDWTVPPSIAGVRLVDAPVLFFVATHKAFRGELAELRRVAEEAAESGECGRELVVGLCRRLEFLKLVYNYHSVAEDEVIFLALDAQVKNVVPTYALEHISIDVYFVFIFHLLDLLMNKDEDAPQMFQELLFSLGTVQTMVCQHMQKEEHQVFPLLMEKFTCEEQSQLVWQYMCMVPLILLEDFLPWLTLYLSFDEKLDVLCCIKLIISKDRLLQEVVVSWIQHEEEGSSFDTDNIYRKGYLLLNGLTNFKDIHKLYPPQNSCGISSFGIPIKGIHLWHAALRRDLKDTTQELYHIRSSNSCLSLPSVLVQLKFITDVLIFYSNTLEKVFYPLFNLHDKNNQSPFCPLIDECQIKGLQRLLFYESQGSAQQEVVGILCQELESLVSGLENNLIFFETEVFPSVTENCASEMQLWLLYTSLLMMPLGLLKCTVTWFCAHLTENQSNSILKNIKSGCPSIYKPFASLLHEWVRKGGSGKTSIERFRQDLEEMFNGRSFYLSEQKRRNIVFYDQMLRKNSGVKERRSVTIPSTSISVTADEHGISYSSVNLHIFFSQTFRKMLPLQNNIAQCHSGTFLTLESRPMDLILYIHRAFMKHLECIVSLSAKLAANVGFLDEFKNRFKLVQEIFQIHSNSEDEILFPALELKGGLQNISHSYSIDHQMETKHFRRTSRILNEISELHDHEGSNETRLQHYRLCLKLHDTCISLHQVLSDHIFREEAEIFPLFKGYFSIEEEEKIVGNMLGRTGVEILQEMIPWLMEYLTSDEQHSAMSLWLHIARNTDFAEWLGEWWEGMTRYNTSTGEEAARSPSVADDPLEIVSLYLLKDGVQSQTVAHDRETEKESASDDIKHSGSGNFDITPFVNGGQDVCPSQDLSEYQKKIDKNRSNEVNERCHEDTERHKKERQKLSHQEHPLCMNQEQLEATIRRVSRDATLDSQKKSQIIQNLLMSNWNLAQKMSHDEASESNHEGVIPGQSPSYQDPHKLTFGCKHYKRNCKLVTPCCNKLYTCIRCHDVLADHLVDRKTITQMMCMKCLVIQPVGTKCTSESCSGFSMGRYFCRICKLFDDDERQIYHCPYCNLCRVGKGLGIGYFHCMKCNACMSKTLLKHDCREKCLEENCPICHEYIFTSTSPAKALPCGHSMHSSCFKVYTNSHYICPICSKSLGDMQVYFGMLDALLAEEKIPEEYSGQTQVILCNDCGKRGNASFHWMYHKCPYCGSYNTRLL